MKKRQPNLFEMLFEDERKLEKEEYANLRTKQSAGYINAEFFRRNMFNATARGARIKYKKPKVIWEKNGRKISVSHSLHQKHADILSLLHTDNKAVSKPRPDGGYDIYLSLYSIAKQMGYKHPSSSVNKVKNFIDDLRWTDLIVHVDGDGTYKSTILDDAYYSENKDTFVVSIKGKNAKILAHTTAIKFGKELNHRIVSIPDKHSKIKAMVRFVISNKPKVHGYTLGYIFARFGIGQSGSHAVRENSKSLFKRQLKDNEGLLSEFNLSYDNEDQKVYYEEQLKDVTFELGLNHKKVYSKIEERKSPYLKYHGKKIKVADINYTILRIDSIKGEKEIVDVWVQNSETEATGAFKGLSIDILTRALVD